jgi:hypothetical protein
MKEDDFKTLELQTEFSKKFAKLVSVLKTHEISDLRWLINRAYFTGYKNGGKDSEE